LGVLANADEAIPAAADGARLAAPVIESMVYRFVPKSSR